MSSSDKLMHIEPGGESRPYESIKEVTKTPPKQTGQFRVGAAHTYSDIKRDLEPGEGKEDYVGYNGQDSMGEDGFGGRTTDISGEADKDLKPPAPGDEEEARKSRREQRYGPGSGVGA